MRVCALHANNHFHINYSLNVVLFEELYVRKCSDDILTNQLLQVVVLKELVPGTLMAYRERREKSNVIVISTKLSQVRVNPWATPSFSMLHTEALNKLGVA